jgi:hypothetical protein
MTRHPSVLKRKLSYIYNIQTVGNVSFAVFGKLWNDILEQNNLTAQDIPK